MVAVRKANLPPRSLNLDTRQGAPLRDPWMLLCRILSRDQWLPSLSRCTFHRAGSKPNPSSASLIPSIIRSCESMLRSDLFLFVPSGNGRVDIFSTSARRLSSSLTVRISNWRAQFQGGLERYDSPDDCIELRPSSGYF